MSETCRNCPNRRYSTYSDCQVCTHPKTPNFELINLDLTPNWCPADTHLKIALLKLRGVNHQLKKSDSTPELESIIYSIETIMNAIQIEIGD